MAVAISRPVSCNGCGKVHELQGDKRGLRCECGALTMLDGGERDHLSQQFAR